MTGFGVLRRFLTALLLLLSALSLGSSLLEPQCRPPPVTLSSSLNFNVFEQVLSNFSRIASGLRQAPYVAGVDVNIPAYQFQGNGFNLLDAKVSNAIRSSSCASRELTIYASIFFRDSQSDGPLLDIAYADGLGASCPAFGLYLDAKADLVTLAYRHLGLLHTESFQTRLHGGKWRKYAVSVSGNLLSLYVDCVFVTSRLVPLPDFCVNDSDVIVSVVDSANREKLRVEYENGLYIYLQNVGFKFGDNGVQQQCPDLPEVCPSCGQFLSIVEQVYELQGEVEVLQTRVSRLERGVQGQPNDTGNATTPAPTQGGGGRSNCFDDGRTVMDRDFFTRDSGDGEMIVCFCENGNSFCENMLQLCPDTEPPTGPTQPSNSSNTNTSPGCTDYPELPGRVLAPNESVFQYQSATAMCLVLSCSFSSFVQNFARSSDDVDCFSSNRTEYEQCLPTFDEYQQNVSKCCRICDACAFVECPDNAVCQDGSCTCSDGFEPTDDGLCADIDECGLGKQLHGQNCPPFSCCINTPGTFDCVCEPGYSMEVMSNGDRRCEDNDECFLGTVCPEHSSCENSPGSFLCTCDRGFDKDADGNCTPVCEPACQNGGFCDSPGSCSCLPGFDGPSCEVDIDECSVGTHNCNHPKSECVNTNGGFFCRCEPGYQAGASGAVCLDVDECALKIHNCISRAGVSCENTIGGFTCLCHGVDCTGSCVRRGEFISNRQSYKDGCRNCTCIDGELTCRKTVCDCNNPNVDLECCGVCRQQNCVVNGSILIRPGATWVNPARSCERCSCNRMAGVLVPQCEDLSQDCLPLNCPSEFQVMPMGKCCPICQLPQCDSSVEGRVARLRNGCKTCSCQGGVWRCEDKVRCGPAPPCEPTDIMFLKDNCCPICRHQVLLPPVCPS